MFKRYDKVLVFDTSLNHVGGTKCEVVALHKGLNCVTVSYGNDGDLIQVNNCQVIKLKEKDSD